MRRGGSASIRFSGGRWLVLCLCVVSMSARAADEDVFETEIRPFLQEYCVTCHGPDKQRGDFRVDTLTSDFSNLANAGHWIEVRDNINLGEMPPEEPYPSIVKSEKISAWVAEGIRKAEKSALAKDGRVLLRRLTRAEFANTVRDLLGMTFLPGESPADLLPPDGTVDGFDKVSAGLMLDPSLLEKTHEVARRIADKAIVTGPPAYPTETMRMEFEEIAENRAIRYLCDRPGFVCEEDSVRLMGDVSTRSFARLAYPGEKRTIPVAGMYRVSVSASATRGAEGKPVVMRVEQSHPDEAKEKIMEVEVTAPPGQPEVYTVVVPRDPDGGEWKVSLVDPASFLQGNPTYTHYANRVVKDAGRAGDFATAIRFRGRMQLEGGHEQTLIRPDRIETDDLAALHLDWIEIEGPLVDQWPPRSHTTIFPSGTEFEPDPGAIRDLFERLLPLAWRRPVTGEEIEPLVAFVAGELEQGKSIEEAMRAGLAAVLTSPHFLYLFEPSGENDSDPRRLTDWELASRLSYFLWSSMPDKTLFDLARSGRLRDRSVLESEVDRMMEDPRIEGFVEGFGAQWLRTGSFLAFEPDARQYPGYDAELGEAMVGETLAYFREILMEDVDLRSFIDSDFAMMNERLARHYGFPGVKGEEFRRIALPPDSRRGGLLTQAGVLLAGSDGDRTKPVSRGVYVLEVLFNDPPQPPPPNAGEIEPNIEGENLTVRERLLKHQQIETCAACHRGIDPYGLAWENYDVIGRWRDRQNGEGFRERNAPPIVATGTLPNGKAFDGPESFKALLMAQDERFFRGLTEKMFVYALGRPHLPTDRPAVESIVDVLENESPTLRALIKHVVTSRAFLEK